MSVTGANVVGVPEKRSYPKGFSASLPMGSSGSSVSVMRKSCRNGSIARRWWPGRRSGGERHDAQARHVDRTGAVQPVGIGAPYRLDEALQLGLFGFWCAGPPLGFPARGTAMVAAAGRAVLWRPYHDLRSASRGGRTLPLQCVGLRSRPLREHAFLALEQHGFQFGRSACRRPRALAHHRAQVLQALVLGRSRQHRRRCSMRWVGLGVPDCLPVAPWPRGLSAAVSGERSRKASDLFGRSQSGPVLEGRCQSASNITTANIDRGTDKFQNPCMLFPIRLASWEMSCQRNS